MRSVLFTVFVLGGLVAGCTVMDGSAMPCADDSECPALYRCAAGMAVCEAMPLLSAPAQDSGRPVVDSGSPFDAGVTVDSGVTFDAGVKSDAGMMIDAGVKTDAGTMIDAGVPVKFSTDVLPIFATRCIACHGDTPLGNAVKLTPADAHAMLVGVAAVCAPTVMSVKPGDPAGSMLWLKLGGGSTYCGGPMPTTGSLKTAQPAEFQIIEAWIRQGAKND